jgi:CHAT domain-containing protein
VGKIYSETLAGYENNPELMGHKGVKVAVNFYKARYFKEMNDLLQSYYLLKEDYNLSKQDGNIIKYLAFMCRELKKFDEAIYYYNKLREFLPLESYIGLGECARESGNANKSFYYAHLAVKEATPSNTDLASYHRLISFFKNIKHYELVEKLDPEILKKIIQENPKSKTLSMIYTNTGIYFWEQSEFDKALEAFQLAILSVLPLELRKDICADLNYNQCISYPDLIRCLNNKGEAFYQRSKAQKDKLSEIDDLKQCLKNLNLSVEQMNKYKIQLSTEDQMFLYSDLTSVKYPNIIKVCLELFNLTGDSYYHQQALKYAEQGRASIMLSLLRSNNGSKVGLIPDKYKNLEDSINKQIALINQKLSTIKEGSQTKYKLNTQLDVLSSKRTELEKIYKSKYPAFYSLKYSSEVIGARQFQSTLSNDECVVEFLLNRNFLISFYIDQKTLLIHTDTLRKIDLAQLAEKFYKRVSQFNPDQFKRDTIKSFAAEGLKLYNILLKPFEEKLKGKKLIIVADNSLRKIPFEALLTTSPRDFNGYRDLPYLINRNPIYYAPSITFLNELRQRPLVKKRAKLLAIAPVYSSLKLNDTITRQLYAVRSDTSVFGSLPNAQKEIDYANLAAGGRYLKEKAASETRFKELAGKFDIIHIATHGILNTESSLQSSLLFADSYPNDDGLLYNYEIYNLEQSSQLVILSACNTGAGRNYGGEGVISTGRGFLSSGSRSVIMTLWPVNDQASFELIKGFYDGLKDKLTICEALRRSKISYMRTADNMHCHPFFWTGYVIYGDASISLSIRNNEGVFFLISGIILLIAVCWIIWRLKKRNILF